MALIGQFVIASGLSEPKTLWDNNIDSAPALMRKCFKDLSHDGSAMVKSLFGRHPPAVCMHSKLQVGRFRIPITSYLHRDDGELPYGLMLRALALAFQYVKKAEEKRFPELIKIASGKDDQSNIARQELRNNGTLLRALPNTLYLMPIHPTEGLLHASAPIPYRSHWGKTSILYRSNFDYIYRPK